MEGLEPSTSGLKEWSSKPPPIRLTPRDIRILEALQVIEIVQRRHRYRNIIIADGYVKIQLEDLLMKTRIDIPSQQIADFCQRWMIIEFGLFGSVLRDDFQPASDVDVLVSFAPEARWSLFDLVEMENELSQLLKREVDLVEREAVERSPNYIRRKNILQSAQVVYAA